MIRALCLLCGGRKETVESTCLGCGHAFHEDESELAHLLSSAHLSQEELEQASARISGGERPFPKRTPSAAAGHPGLSLRDLTLLVVICLLLTPLYGFVVAWGWRGRRSRAARQAFGAALVVAVVLAIFWGLAFVRL